MAYVQQRSENGFSLDQLRTIAPSIFAEQPAAKVFTPLIFLGGVFYSASLLPEPFRQLTEFNPIYYMISLVRYGFLGKADVNIELSLLLLAVATFALFSLNLLLFKRGYKLRS